MAAPRRKGVRFGTLRAEDTTSARVLTQHDSRMFVPNVDTTGRKICVTCDGFGRVCDICGGNERTCAGCNVFDNCVDCGGTGYMP